MSDAIQRYPDATPALSSANTNLTGAAVGDLVAVSAVSGANVATAFARVTPPMNPIAAAIIFGG